jgi:hypothetical protein
VRCAVLVAALAVCLVAAGSAAAAPKRPWLWQCEQIGLETAKFQCYVRLLLQDVDASGEPARELPRIDRRARAADTSLEGMCHVLMHEVGRRFAREHHVTLENLQRYVPQSNDPGCSAGFGMGLVMALGPQLIRTEGRSAVPTCLRLATRYRSYTCLHSLGHALMRGYHEALPLAVASCRKLGPRVAPDCAQGAFHDYWIALRGADDTTPLKHGDRSARTLCARYAAFARGCWYRFFVENPLGPSIAGAADIERVCRGLRALQRSGCVAAASLDLPDGPLTQNAICARLGAADAVSCLLGVHVPDIAPTRRLELIQRCGRFVRAARQGCYEWYGRTLAVVTNGRFRCSLLAAPGRAWCAVGKRREDDPLVTFS